jgi:uncharacterized membrane protein YqaE (UPF0057 family)
VLYIIAILIPPLAVVMATTGDRNAPTRVLINIIWCLLCWLPGIAHACLVVAGTAHKRAYHRGGLE